MTDKDIFRRPEQEQKNRRTAGGWRWEQVKRRKRRGDQKRWKCENAEEKTHQKEKRQEDRKSHCWEWQEPSELTELHSGVGGAQRWGVLIERMSNSNSSSSSVGSRLIPNQVIFQIWVRIYFLWHNSHDMHIFYNIIVDKHEQGLVKLPTFIVVVENVQKSWPCAEFVEGQKVESTDWTSPPPSV